MVQQCVASLMNLACCLAARAQAPTELKGHNALVYSLAFSPSGKLLASGSFDNTIKLWEYPSGKELRSLGGHAAPVYCVAFSPDGAVLASSSQDQTIRFWNVADGKLLRENRVYVAPGGYHITLGGQRGNASIHLDSSPAMWGVRIMFSTAVKGEFFKGSSVKTSKAAPATRPCLTA